MKRLRQTGQFKKDLKRYANRPGKMKKLLEVLAFLRNDITLSEHYKAHTLTGDYSGCMECHIEGDFLLIWIDEESDTIGLLRLGSHSELFGKGTKR